jgi:hypothetical protein
LIILSFQTTDAHNNISAISTITATTKNHYILVLLATSADSFPLDVINPVADTMGKQGVSPLSLSWKNKIIIAIRHHHRRQSG